MTTATILPFRKPEPVKIDVLVLILGDDKAAEELRPLLTAENLYHLDRLGKLLAMNQPKKNK